MHRLTVRLGQSDGYMPGIEAEYPKRSSHARLQYHAQESALTGRAAAMQDLSEQASTCRCHAELDHGRPVLQQLHGYRTDSRQQGTPVYRRDWPCVAPNSGSHSADAEITTDALMTPLRPEDLRGDVFRCKRDKHLRVSGGIPNVSSEPAQECAAIRCPMEDCEHRIFSFPIFIGREDLNPGDLPGRLALALTQ